MEHTIANDSVKLKNDGETSGDPLPNKSKDLVFSIITESIKNNNQETLQDVFTELMGKESVQNKTKTLSEKRNNLRIRNFLYECNIKNPQLTIINLLTMKGYFSLAKSIYLEKEETKNSTFGMSLYCMWVYYSSTRGECVNELMSLLGSNQCPYTGLDVSTLEKEIEYRNSDDSPVENTEAMIEILTEIFFTKHQISNSGKYSTVTFRDAEYNRFLNDIYTAVIVQLISTNNQKHIVPLFDRLFNDHLVVPSGQLFIRPEIYNSKEAIDILIEILDRNRKRNVKPHLIKRYNQMVGEHLRMNLDPHASCYDTLNQECANMKLYGIPIDEIGEMCESVHNRENKTLMYMQAKLMNMHGNTLFIPEKKHVINKIFDYFSVLFLLVVVVFECYLGMFNGLFPIQIGLIFMMIIFFLYSYSIGVLFESIENTHDQTPRRGLINEFNIARSCFVLINWIVVEVIRCDSVSIFRTILALNFCVLFLSEILSRSTRPWYYKKYTVTEEK